MAFGGFSSVGALRWRTLACVCVRARQQSKRCVRSDACLHDGISARHAPSGIVVRNINRAFILPMHKCKCKTRNRHHVNA